MKTTPPSLESLKIPDSAIPAAISSSDTDMRARAYVLLFETATDQEIAVWWPKLLQEKDSYLRLESLEALLINTRASALALAFAGDPENSILERCLAQLISTRLKIELGGKTPTAALRKDGLEAKFSCALSRAVREERPEELQRLLRNQTLPITLPFFWELRDSSLKGLSPAIKDAYDLAEELYRSQLSGSWLALNPEHALPVLENDLSQLDIDDRMEFIDFIWSVKSAGATKILGRISEIKDVSGEYARLALVARGAEKHKFAVEVLQKHKDPELRAFAARALGEHYLGRKISEKNRSQIESALLSTLRDPNPNIRVSVIAACGSALIFNAARPIAKLKEEHLAVRLEIEGTLRALSRAAR